MSNPYRNAFYDPEVQKALCAEQQAFKHHQANINLAITAYGEAMMDDRPKPKFILNIESDRFRAKPSRANFADVIAVAVGGAIWFAVLAGLWVLFG